MHSTEFCAISFSSWLPDEFRNHKLEAPADKMRVRSPSAGAILRIIPDDTTFISRPPKLPTKIAIFHLFSHLATFHSRLPLPLQSPAVSFPILRAIKLFPTLGDIFQQLPAAVRPKGATLMSPFVSTLIRRRDGVSEISPHKSPAARSFVSLKRRTTFFLIFHLDSSLLLVRGRPITRCACALDFS